MSEKNNNKVLLSLKNVDVKFNVRGRTLSAIRNVSLDIYENESLAIVGESGSGKSVLTKTFAGLLDSNGYISNGSIILSDDEISKTDIKLTNRNKRLLVKLNDMLNKYSVLERGAEEYRQYVSRQKEIEYARNLAPEVEKEYQTKISDLENNIIDLKNYLWTLDKKDAADAKEIEKTNSKISGLQADMKKAVAERAKLVKEHHASYANNKELIEADKKSL